jgi:hypothetical protein
MAWAAGQSGNEAMHKAEVHVMNYGSGPQHQPIAQALGVFTEGPSA